jgi:hypothetical protein
MTELTKITFLVPKSDVEVHETAHAIITQTMASGQASNGVGSFYNREPLDYHCWKALHHLLRLWQEQDIDAKEKDSPHLKHLYNACTRLVLATVVHMKNSKPEKEILLEDTPD